MNIPVTAIPRSPRHVALVYALFGVGWIVVTDQLVYRLAASPGETLLMQTAKGWAFVAVSSVFVYGLVRYSRRSLETTNERLRGSVRQTSILQRILRHNVRNACTVIGGNAELLDDEVPDEKEAHLEAIETSNSQLMTLSEKSSQLWELMLGDPANDVDVDLVEKVNAHVAALRADHPEARFTTDLPDRLSVETHPHIGEAIREVLTNAVEHNDADEPSVRVSARRARDGTAVVDVVDDGPGIPEMERDVLDVDRETPLHHSQGLGLWIAKALIERADGGIDVVDVDQGTHVKMTFPDDAHVG